jgi:polysaccharide biosynthesis transport protein
MKNSIVPLELSSETAPVLGTGPAAPAAYNPQEWGFPPQEPAETGGMGAKFRRYIAALKRFWWLIISLTILGTAGGVFATQFIHPTYEAQGMLWIADVVTQGGGPNPVKNSNLLPNGSWVELFRNFSVVDSVVAKQQLWYRPATTQDSIVLNGIRPTPTAIDGSYTLWTNSLAGKYTLSEVKRGPIEHGLLGDSIGRSIGLAWQPDPVVFASHGTVRFSVNQPRQVALGLINQLEIQMADASNFLRVKLNGSSKRQTAEILNAWMKAFVDKAAELRGRNSSQTANVLKEQMDAAKLALDNAERSLEAFRIANSTMPRDGGISPSSAVSGGGGGDVGILGEFTKARNDYEEARRDRLSLQALAKVAREGGQVTPEAINSIPSSLSAPSLVQAANELLQKQTELRGLQQQFTSEYPKVRAATAAIDQLQRQTIPMYLENAARAVERKETILLARLTQDSLKLQSMPQRSNTEAGLRREVQLKEASYTSLATRYETTRLSSSNDIPDVTVLYPALAAAASSRNLLVMLVGGGIFGSLFLGMAIALLLDMIDYRFRYPEQITDELKLDVLGAVPAVPKPGEAADPEATLQSVEAFRGLRLNMHHAFDAPPVMLTITSPGAGDGKSMISSNLALSFADAGYRTLLIDGDIRRGKLHSVFGIERRPGLLDYLAGDADIPAVMRAVPMHAGLTIIPSGTRRHRGPELLTSARLPQLIAAARGKYDVIIMDSAPLAAGIDAYALGVVTGSMILVMRTGVTDRRVAKAKLKLMARMPVRVLGAVVNAVPAAGLYSEYSYLYGYQPDVDTDLEQDDIVPALQSVDPPR